MNDYFYNYFFYTLYIYVSKCVVRNIVKQAINIVNYTMLLK